MERPNAVQNCNTLILAVTTKILWASRNSIIGNKVAREGDNGHEFTHGFTEVKKKAPNRLGWHLYYEHTHNTNFIIIELIILFFIYLTKTCTIDL